MRNFIKNHTPEWLDGWCWLAVFMLVSSIGWAVFGSNPFTRGLQLGMAVYWFGFLVHKAIVWHSLQVHKAIVWRSLQVSKLDLQLMNHKDQIILLQLSGALKEELKGQS